MVSISISFYAKIKKIYFSKKAPHHIETILFKAQIYTHSQIFKENIFKVKYGNYVWTNTVYFCFIHTHRQKKLKKKTNLQELPRLTTHELNKRRFLIFRPKNMEVYVIKKNALWGLRNFFHIITLGLLYDGYTPLFLPYSTRITYSSLLN